MTDPRLDYISKVYSALKDNVSGFNKTPGDFLDSMNNPDYRQKVYSALKDNVQGFNKSQQDFESVTAQKKNSLLTSSPYYVAAPEDTEDSQTSSTVATPSQSQSVPVPQSSSEETQQSKPQQPQAFDPATFMRKSRELALENTPIQDNTVAVQPSRNLSATESQLNKVSNQKRSEEVKKEAIVNSTAQYLKNKGINAPVGSAQFNQQLAKTQALVDNGQAIVGVSPDGQFGLKRVTGVWENLKNGWNEATQNAKEADDFVNNMTIQQQVDYVKSHDVKQPDQFIGEQPSTLGSFGHFIGGAAPFLGKATAGALIGAGAVAAAPESMGASLAGLPTAMSFILTAPDMANQGAQQEIIRRFQILKNQNPDMSDVDAMEEARKGALAGGIGGILTNAALIGTGLKTPLSLEAKGVVGKTLQEVTKSAVHMGAVSAGVTAAQQLEGEAEGIHTSASDKLKAIEDSFKENATTGAMLTALMHGVPKIMESAIKYSLKDTPPDQIRNVLQANENAGTVPEGTTDKLMSDISSYNDALNKTVDGLSPEATASVAGLIQKKNSLIEESKTKDDSFKPVYNEKIDAIDRQIQDIQRTGKPFEHEIDEVTGKPYQQPTYDDVAQQQVQELAQKIAKGKQVTDPTDLQTQANFPKELEAELQRLQKEEQTSQAGKENPKSIISDNIKSYLDKSNDVSSEKPAEPVSSPVISDLKGEVMMNGERGHLRTDEENNVLFDNGTKETLLGKTTDKNFNSTKAADLGIKPIPKVEVKDDNVKIDGEDYTLNHDKEGGAFGKDKDGNVVSVNVLKDGEPRTIRDKDLALDIAIAKNNHDFESKPEPKEYAPVQQAIKDSFTAEHGQKADDIINSMPDEVADTFAAMDNKIEALAPEETQEMVIRASEWADKAREEIKNGSSGEKEKSDAIKMLDKFDKDLNKYYGKLEKQRKSQADADVKREQAESLAAAKQARQKAKQLEVEKDNLVNATQSTNKLYNAVENTDEPDSLEGKILQFFAGGGVVHPDSFSDEVTGKISTGYGGKKVYSKEATENNLVNTKEKDRIVKGKVIKGADARTIDSLAHSFAESFNQHSDTKVTDQDAKNEIISVLQGNDRESAAKKFLETYNTDYVEEKHNREQAEAYQAYEKKLQEDEENYLTEKGHEQDEIEQDPEYIKHLIKLYETETVPVNDKQPDTGSKAESSEARSVTENVEPEGADRPKRPSELRRPAEDQPRSDEEQPQSSKKQVGDIFRNFADIVEKGKISKLGGFKSSTGFDAVWDGSLTVVAETLRKTADLADAIQAGLEHIKNSDWYKSLTDKKDFDEKYVAHLEGEYNKFKEQPKESSQQEGKSGTLGISHEALNALAEKIGLPEIERGKSYDPKELADRGRKLLNAGADPNKIADDFYSNGLTDENGVSVIRAKIEQLFKNGEQIPDKDSTSFKENFDQLSKFMQVEKDMGTFAHRVMKSFQGQRDIDTDSFVYVSMAAERKLGRELNKEEKAKIDGLTKQVSNLKSKISEYEERLKNAIDKDLNGETEVKLSVSDKAKKLAATIRKGKAHKPGVFSAATPASLVWDTAVETVAQVVEKGGKLVDAIQKGVEYIKSTDWYKGLSEDKKKEAEDAFIKEHRDSDGTSLESLQEMLADKKDKFTPQEAKAIWDYAKKEYLNTGSDYLEMLSGVANDLGYTMTQVSKAIITPKTQRLSDEMWKQRSELSKNRASVKRWLDNKGGNLALKGFRTAIDTFREAAVFGHGAIFIGTHAMPTLFDIPRAKHTIRGFLNAYKAAYGKTSNYELMIADLKNSPNYLKAQRAGLQNNPERIGSDTEIISHHLKWFTEAGERGFNAIKILRQNLFDSHYNALPETLKQDPEVLKEIAHIVNNATGATNYKVPNWMREVTFAGGMEISRWERIIKNPAKAADILGKLATGKATPAEKVFVRVWATRAGTIAGVYTSALIVNNAINAYLYPDDDKKRINFFNPSKGDWFKLKFGSVVIDPTSGVGTSLRFLTTIASMPFESEKYIKSHNQGDNRKNALAKKVLGYGLGKLSPGYTTIGELVLKHDYTGNTIPFSNDKPFYKSARKLTVPEYVEHKLPLPLAEGFEIYNDAAHEAGANDKVWNAYTKGIFFGGLSGLTGVRSYEDTKAAEPPKKETIIPYYHSPD